MLDVPLQQRGVPLDGAPPEQLLGRPHALKRPVLFFSALPSPTRILASL